MPKQTIQVPLLGSAVIDGPKIMKSAACYYIGASAAGAPFDRYSDYFRSEAVAQHYLKEMLGEAGISGKAAVISEVTNIRYIIRVR